MAALCIPEIPQISRALALQLHLRLELPWQALIPGWTTLTQGRLLMWGWLQERRKVGSYDYAGCLSVPRIMYLRGDRLHQEPAPEVGLHLQSCMCNLSD